jgi:hypothetical protein
MKVSLFAVGCMPLLACPLTIPLNSFLPSFGGIRLPCLSAGVGIELLFGIVQLHTFILCFADIAYRIPTEKRHQERRFKIEVSAPAENTSIKTSSLQFSRFNQNKPAIFTGEPHTQILKLETVAGTANRTIYEYFSRNMFFARYHIQHAYSYHKRSRLTPGITRRAHNIETAQALDEKPADSRSGACRC